MPLKLWFFPLLLNFIVLETFLLSNLFKRHKPHNKLLVCATYGKTDNVIFLF